MKIKVSQLRKIILETLSGTMYHPLTIEQLQSAYPEAYYLACQLVIRDSAYDSEEIGGEDFENIFNDPKRQFVIDKTTGVLKWFPAGSGPNALFRTHWIWKEGSGAFGSGDWQLVSPETIPDDRSKTRH